MVWSGIEPLSLGPLANILPFDQYIYIYSAQSLSVIQKLNSCKTQLLKLKCLIDRVNKIMCIWKCMCMYIWFTCIWLYLCIHVYVYIMIYVSVIYIYSWAAVFHLSMFDWIIKTHFVYIILLRSLKFPDKCLGFRLVDEFTKIYSLMYKHLCNMNSHTQPLI